MRLIFTVPYTCHEILTNVEEKQACGIAYDPLSTTAPVSWASNYLNYRHRTCYPCETTNGVTMTYLKLPLKTRRAVRILCTARLVKSGYKVRVMTGAKTTHTAIARRDPTGKHWTIIVKKLKGPTLTIDDSARTISPGGSNRDFESPVLVRTIRMLASARDATDADVMVWKSWRV